MLGGMNGLLDRWRSLCQELRAARTESKLLDEQVEQQRFEDRQARHEAGIYEPPANHGGF